MIASKSSHNLHAMHWHVGKMLIESFRYFKIRGSNQIAVQMKRRSRMKPVRIPQLNFSGGSCYGRLACTWKVLHFKSNRPLLEPGRSHNPSPKSEK